MSPTLHFNKTNDRKVEILFNNNRIFDNNINNNNNPVFESLPELQPILDFDVSDEPMDEIDGNIVSTDGIDENKNPRNGRKSRNSDKKPFKATEAVLRRQAPTFLLIESLIWNFCCYNESDPQKQKTLFFSLCQRLEEYKIIGTSYRTDSLHPIREFLVTKFKELVRQIRSGDSSLKPLLFTSSDAISSAVLNASHLIDQTSRYSEEFIDLGLIEAGGFGIVNKAKYRFDDCEYAVKMIRFKYKSDVDYKKITREVQLYANLSSHPNVVAYKTAWIENWCLHREKSVPFTKHLKTSKDHKQLIEVSINSEDFDQNSNVKENDLSIRFEESSKSGLRIESTKQTITETFQLKQINEIETIVAEEDDDEEEEDDSSDDNSIDSMDDSKQQSLNDLLDNRRTVTKRKKTFSVSSTQSQSDSAVEYRNCYELQKYNNRDNIPDIDFEDVDDIGLNNCPFSCSDFGAILYIQMELCGKNLKTWLRERNDTCFTKYNFQPKSGNILDFVDKKEAKNIFRQVLKGVEYFHSQHLIHRDLKPQNILFSIDGSKVKIGDFGLATIHCGLDNDQISINYFTQSSIPSPTSPTTSNHCQWEDQNHTGAIGTSIYASPEQKAGKQYDYKTDIFSLGIILFELFYPLSTDMEKVKCVSNITKKQVLPKNLQKLYPNVSKIILWLTHPNPALRPNATEVLHSSLFLSEEQIHIKRLEKLNEELTTGLTSERNKNKDLVNRLEALRRESSLKDKEIENLRKQLEVMSTKFN